MNHSLVRFHAMPFYVLVVDNKIEEKAIKSIFSNLHFLYLENINQSEIAQKIIKKYQGVYQDGLRWSPKSVLVRFLLDSYAKVLYLDCDLYFYNDYQFLLNELDTYNIILT
ncbi:MAG: hypothetical protein RML94_09575, partial [Bacteroidia bacterium]|nr:hypothetical protein [Bacteroidia bacterium]